MWTTAWPLVIGTLQEVDHCTPFVLSSCVAKCVSKKHIVVILEMCDIMAVASHGDTLLFTDNYRLYYGLQLDDTSGR